MNHVLTSLLLLLAACEPATGSVASEGDDASSGAAGAGGLANEGGAHANGGAGALGGAGAVGGHGGSGGAGATLCAPGSRTGDLAGTASFTTPKGTTIIVRTPAGYDPLVPSPLLLLYSGATFTAAMTESDTGLTSPATAQGYVLAYVDHLVPDTDANINEAAAAVKSVQGAWCIAPERVYLSGHSDGGSMTHLVMLRGLVDAAAIAPSASGLRADSLPSISCATGPLPMIALHSKDDTMFPIAGGYGADVAKWFADCSGCGAPSSPDGSGCIVYATCTAGSEVKYCEGTGKHGSWPPERNKLVLDFFARF